MTEANVKSKPRIPVNFDRHRWRIQRASWAVFGLIICLALSGLTGAGGPLSRVEVLTQGSTVQYPRITRWQSSDTLEIAFDAGGDRRSVTLSSSFLKAFEVENIEPQPAEARVTAAGQKFTFITTAGQKGEVTFNLRVEHPGLTVFNITIDEATPVGLHILALP